MTHFPVKYQYKVYVAELLANYYFNAISDADA